MGKVRVRVRVRVGVRVRVSCSAPYLHIHNSNYSSGHAPLCPCHRSQEAADVLPLASEEDEDQISELCNLQCVEEP